MKKQILRIVILSICFFINEKTNAQNSLPNYSFENYSVCPPSGNALYYALPWFQPQTYNGNVTNSCSTELFNICAGSSTFGVGVPLNTLGYQLPRTGNGYAGFFAYADTVNTREYLEVELDSVLRAGQKYCVEFYVSLADSTGIAVSNIGAYFSNDSLLDSTYYAIDYVAPQIENSVWNILNDKTNWMKIFGVFTAQGGEKFMTIGNFHKPSNTNYIVVGGTNMLPNYAYYYIDDISVTACDTTWIGINEVVKKEENFSVYPNPASSIITIESKKYQDLSIRIVDVLGREVIESTKYEVLGIKNIDVSHLPSGMYIIQLQNKTGVVSKKFVKE